MTNPLIAQAHDTDKTYAGTGVLSDLSTFSKNLSSDASALSTGVSGVASGLGLLGAVMAPLNTLASAGVGFLIEHLNFLEAPLEELTGDPAAINAQAETWRNVAQQVRASAEQYGSAAETLPATWHGQGADAYQGAASTFQHALQASGDSAEGAANAIENAGALVGVERGIVRDLIAEFVGWLIVEAGIALATSWCTFGGSIAAFTAFSVGQALHLASTVADRLSALSTKLDELSQLVSRMNGSLDQVAGGIRQLGNKVDNASASLTRAADNAAHAPGAAQTRVENFFERTAPGADKVSENLNHAWYERTDVQQYATEHVADRSIPGTNQTVREVLDTNVLGGKNYMPHNDPEYGMQGPGILDDHAWSTGDSIKLGSSAAKAFTEEPIEPADEQETYGRNSAQEDQNMDR